MARAFLTYENPKNLVDIKPAYKMRILYRREILCSYIQNTLRDDSGD